jgi:hypothetical protein
MRSLHVENRYDPQGQTFIQAFILHLFPQLSSATALKEMTWTVVVDRGKATRTFIGVSEDTLLRQFSFSSVLRKSIGNRLEKLRISITEYPVRLHEPTENYLKNVYFSELADHGRLEVAP